jgi:hypothetical protein
VATIADTIATIAVTGGEDFTLCRDAKQAESLRVSAYNIRRKMPKLLIEDVGIQKYEEDGKFFLRIYKRGNENQKWKRDEETGKLVPIAEQLDSTPDSERERIIKLLKEEGRNDKEIEDYFRED